jgi:hypothetical protein
MKTCLTDRMVAMAEDPKEFLEHIMHVIDNAWDYCTDIDYSFLGYMENYENLSKLVPERDIVIDVGCSCGFQQVFFRNHHQYIGINEHMGGMKKLQKNAIFIVGEFKDIIDYVLAEIVSKKHYDDGLFKGPRDIFGIANMSILYHPRAADNLEKFKKVFERGWIR